MKITLSAIKADVGGIGGHLRPNTRMLQVVEELLHERGKGILIDFRVSFTGDDIAILCTHQGGVGNSEVHRLAWDAFRAATDVAAQCGLYGAGQDLLKDAFSGNVRGLGPGVAEMEFEERPNEPFLLFAADKTDPGAYNLPLYLAFCDPMYNSGLILSPKMFKGFRMTIMDVAQADRDRVVALEAPEELYDIAALLRDTERFVVESVHSRESGSQTVAVSTTRLHNIAGKYTGKDDPVMLVRTQGAFPATGEVLAPFSLVPYVAGFMRGSHNGPFMPIRQNGTVSYFDGPPVVSCMAYCVHEGRISEGVDVFDQPFWDVVRREAARKAMDIRRQGFFGNAMLPWSELEYGGIVQKLQDLEGRFSLR